MNPTFLHRLEQAFTEACELNDHGSQAAYCRRIAEEDAALADELRMMLSIRDEAEELFAHKLDQFSLLLTSLGDTKRSESVQELLDFLGGISESKNEDEIATIRGFSLRELVSVGATGFVFRGVDNQLQRDVAVKVLAPSIARDSERRRAFTREARLASTVRHPNVVPIHYVSDEPESTLVFFVMDWVGGVLLQDLVASSPPKQEQCQGLLRQIVDGVDAIHARGIVHRDLKPGNIIVGERSHVTILDFGLAREQDLKDTANSAAGTPLYMSPEQLLGENLTYRSDLFSLAEIACVLLTGKHPYPAKSIAELSEVVLGGSPRIETENVELASALTKGMSTDPMQRYESGSELIERCLTLPSTTQDAASDPPRTPSTETSRRRLIVAAWLFALAALVTVIMAIISWWPGSTDGESTNPTTGNIEKKRSGEWIDEDHYRNFAGIEFIRIEASASKIDSWPPASENPELFENLGWANREVDSLVGSQLVTRGQYLQIMGQLPAGVPEDPNELDAPVTMVSFDDATRFCKRLSDADPDHNRYGICNANNWTLAVYGSQLLDGKATTADIMSNFRRCSRGDEPESSTKAIPLIGDVLGNYWEWSSHKYRKPTTLEGIVSYSTIPEETSDPIHQVLGGTTNDIFLHAHDMFSGMNDHYHSSHNLTVRTEADGETSYLHPSHANQRGSLRYRYHTIAPIIEARLLVPFALLNAKASAGIRIRSASQNEQDLASSEWQDVYSWHNKILYPEERNYVDLTPFLAGATEVDVEYWLTIEDSFSLHHAQLGRTSPNLTIPSVFCFEATTLGRNESPRQFVPMPASHESKHVGFRVEMSEKVE
ncbi:MAG: serine/threonine-protein kinase [Planctomycetota bacterium]|nr:serine/threonine-protein kinase [Planctomycetota bacterium]